MLGGDIRGAINTASTVSSTGSNVMKAASLANSIVGGVEEKSGALSESLVWKSNWVIVNGSDEMKALYHFFIRLQRRFPVTQIIRFEVKEKSRGFCMRLCCSCCEPNNSFHIELSQVGAANASQKGVRSQLLAALYSVPSQIETDATDATLSLVMLLIMVATSKEKGSVDSVQAYQATMDFLRFSLTQGNHRCAAVLCCCYQQWHRRRQVYLSTINSTLEQISSACQQKQDHFDFGEAIRTITASMNQFVTEQIEAYCRSCSGSGAVFRLPIIGIYDYSEHPHQRWREPIRDYMNTRDVRGYNPFKFPECDRVTNALLLSLELSYDVSQFCKTQMMNAGRHFKSSLHILLMLYSRYEFFMSLHLDDRLGFVFQINMIWGFLKSLTPEMPPALSATLFSASAEYLTAMMHSFGNALTSELRELRNCLLILSQAVSDYYPSTSVLDNWPQYLSNALSGFYMREGYRAIVADLQELSQRKRNKKYSIFSVSLDAHHGITLLRLFRAAHFQAMIDYKFNQHWEIVESLTTNSKSGIKIQLQGVLHSVDELEHRIFSCDLTESASLSNSLTRFQGDAEQMANNFISICLEKFNSKSADWFSKTQRDSFSWLLYQKLKVLGLIAITDGQVGFTTDSFCLTPLQCAADSREEKRAEGDDTDQQDVSRLASVGHKL